MGKKIVGNIGTTNLLNMYDYYFAMSNSSTSINDYSYYSSSSLKGESQPYQKLYSVYGKMKKMDIDRGTYNYLNGGYKKNPTAAYLDTMVNGNYIVNKEYNKELPYVVTEDGKVIVGDRNGNGKGKNVLPTPHPTLIGGRDPKVKIAGILKIANGKIISYDNGSGHYRPNEKSLKWADIAFDSFPKHRKFKGGIKYEK